MLHLSRQTTPPLSPEAHLTTSLARAATMDERKEKQDDKFQESPEQQQPPPRKQEAEHNGNSSEEESMDRQRQADGYKAGSDAEEEEEPTALQVQPKEVVETGRSDEEAASSPSVLGVFAHPCSLLQYLLRACAGWFWASWGLHGAFDDDPKPQTTAPAVALAPPEAAVAPQANATGQGSGDGEKANYFFMQEVVTRVWALAVRRGQRPPGGTGHPREGNGGNGGHHH